MKINSKILLTGTMALCLLFSLWSCRKQSIISQINDEVNITGYLDKFPDQFSEFRKILQLTGNAGYLGAYGNYTLFLPTNDGVKKYLTSVGKSSVEQVDLNELKDLVRFHLIQDTLSTPAFKDGKLQTITMYGQYLITGAENIAGVTKITVNRQANLITGNVRVGNGIIHVIDNMLFPARKTLAQLIEANPKLSIFTQALKETGLYDSLNILPAVNPRKEQAFLTVLAETDSSFKAAGFVDGAGNASYAALKAKFAQKIPRDPKTQLDSLHLFMDYHILPDLKYLSDIIGRGSHGTLAPLEVVTSKISGTSVLINDDDFNGNHETGISLTRSVSEVTASNGVLHITGPWKASVGPVSTGHFEIKVRNPTAVYWDPADDPDIRKVPGVWGKKNNSFPKLTPEDNLIKNIQWDGTSSKPLIYNYSPATSSQVFVNNDYLSQSFGALPRSTFTEFTTPIIVRGKYKIWWDWRVVTGASSTVSFTFDGVPLQRTLTFRNGVPAGTEAEQEAQFYKYYTSPQRGVNAGRMIGIVDVKTTDRHTLRAISVGSNSDDCRVDIIEFKPIAMDQIYPKFTTDFKLIPRP